jgi:hypothetical protein
LLILVVVTHAEFRLAAAVFQLNVSNLDERQFS